MPSGAERLRDPGGDVEHGLRAEAHALGLAGRPGRERDLRGARGKRRSRALPAAQVDVRPEGGRGHGHEAVERARREHRVGAGGGEHVRALRRREERGQRHVHDAGAQRGQVGDHPGGAVVEQRGEHTRSAPRRDPRRSARPRPRAAGPYSAQSSPATAGRSGEPARRRANSASTASRPLTCAGAFPARRGRGRGRRPRRPDRARSSGPSRPHPAGSRDGSAAASA